MAVRCAHKSCDTGLELTKSLRCTENGAPANAGIEASMHSAGMHMRQMQILLSGGKSAADMALGLVDIENVTRFCGKLRVYAKQPVSIRDILVFRRDELERFRPNPNPQANAGKYPHSHPCPLQFSG